MGLAGTRGGVPTVLVAIRTTSSTPPSQLNVRSRYGRAIVRSQREHGLSRTAVVALQEESDRSVATAEAEASSPAETSTLSRSVGTKDESGGSAASRDGRSCGGEVGHQKGGGHEQRDQQRRHGRPGHDANSAAEDCPQ